MPLIRKTLSLSSRFTIVSLVIVAVLVLAVTVLLKELDRIELAVAENTDNIFSIVAKNSEIKEKIHDLSSRVRLLKQFYLFDENVLIQENLLIDDQLQNFKITSDDPEFSLRMDQFIKSFQQFLGNSLSLNNILQERKKIDETLNEKINQLDFYLAKYYSDNELNAQKSDNFIVSLVEIKQLRDSYENAGRLSISIRSRITPYTEKVLLAELEKELSLLKIYLSLFDNYTNEIDQLITDSKENVDQYLLVLKKIQVNLSQRWGILDDLLTSKDYLIGSITKTEALAKAASLDKVDQLLDGIKMLRDLIIIVSIFIILFGAMIFSMIVRRHINQPINQMITGIENFEAGKFQTGIRLDRSDEWHTIEKAFNKMASRLDETYSQLISERKSFDYMAHHDPLTGLANRLFAYETIASMIDSFRMKDEQFSLIYLDLDEFKQVNDSLGHGVGDELLLKIANKLHDIIGSSGTAIRLGGDEFMLLVTKGDTCNHAIEYARSIIERLKQPVILHDHTIVVGCSIGICHFPEHGRDVDTLVRNADTAMYQAKSFEGEKICVYEEHLTQAAVDLMHKVTGIRQAIEKDEFFLVYQPQFDLNTNTIAGVEVLVRWQHPEFGVLTPDKFLPVAERSGLSSEVDQWVFDTALVQVKKWQEMFLSLNKVKVSINFSGKKFSDTDLLTRLENTLKRTQCPASAIEIEITEQDLMLHLDQCVDVMKKLKLLGFSLAIDDFGTGYSSFGYLKNLPVDTLKIDKMFIDDIKANNKELAIVKTMLSLANMLNLSVVAEGIETEMQKVLLQSHGCTYGQGYYLAMPMALEEFEKLLSVQEKK